MVTKLKDLNVNSNIIAWILDFLTGRAQYVKLNKTISSTIPINTGAPQGCVLSPTLYTIYTNDYRSKHPHSTAILKFTCIQGFIGPKSSENDYFDEVKCFVEWCKVNFLTLNVSKTKEMIIDFRHKKEQICQLSIDEKHIQLCTSYKYLGFTIDEKLNWHQHITIMSKKVNQRLFFLRKLRAFNVDKEVLHLFYNAVVQSILTFGISCIGETIALKDKKMLNRSIRKSGKITSKTLPTFEELYEQYATSKAISILKDTTHPMFKEFIRSDRSKRLIQPKTNTERYRKSFVPSMSRRLRSTNT